MKKELKCRIVQEDLSQSNLMLQYYSSFPTFKNVTVRTTRWHTSSPYGMVAHSINIVLPSDVPILSFP